MCRWLIPLLTVLTVPAGCNAPSPMFHGLPAERVTVAGSVFEVRRRGDLAEAVRVNRQYAPRLGPLGARAGQAMERASGCPVDWVLGDQAVMLGRLDCGDG